MKWNEMNMSSSVKVTTHKIEWYAISWEGAKRRAERMNKGIEGNEIFDLFYLIYFSFASLSIFDTRNAPYAAYV